MSGNRFAFISHNTHDFSHPGASNKLPHPHIEACFSPANPLYFITLSEALQHIQPEQLEDLMIEHNWVDEPRRLTEIVDAIDELISKVWYNRHQILREKIEPGIIQIVEKEVYPIKHHATRRNAESLPLIIPHSKSSQGPKLSKPNLSSTLATAIGYELNKHSLFTELKCCCK